MVFRAFLMEVASIASGDDSPPNVMVSERSRFGNGPGWRRSAGVAAYFLGLSVLMTWPQAVSLYFVPAHHDAFFSIWRLAWINHALSNRLPLFDANIFHPVTTTLAYSDATLLQGVLATALIHLRLSPVVAYNLLILAIFAFRNPSRRLWSAVVVMVVGLLLTLGLNGPLFGLLRDYVFGYSGLRVPARAAMIAHCGLAVVAAAGFDALRRTWSPRASRVATATVLAALVIEYWSRVELHELPARPSAYATWLASQRDEVVAGLPLPLLSTLPGGDASFQYESIHHWWKLVNGYSGCYPRTYLELVHVWTDWSAACKALLRERGVTTIAFHLSPGTSPGARVTVGALESDTDLERC